MPNIFEAITSVFKSYVDGDPKPPLHTGEVTALWVQLTALGEAVVFEQAMLNMTTDDELRDILRDGIHLCDSQAEKIKNFLVQEGVPLPEQSPKKPMSDSNTVPLGAKFTDNEIANFVGIKTAYSVVAFATAMSQTIRNDVGQMLLHLFLEQVTFGSTLKGIMRQRGWIKIPPYYHPPGLPQQEES